MGKLQPMWMAYVDENNYVDEKTYSKTFRTAVKSEFHVKLI